MKYSLLAAVGAVAMAAVAGCSPQRLVTSGVASAAVSATVSEASPKNVDRLTTLCGWVQPLATKAMASPKDALQVIGEFGNAYCGQLLAGTVPATTDSGTESWLDGLLTSLQAG